MLEPTSDLVEYVRETCVLRLPLKRRDEGGEEAREHGNRVEARLVRFRASKLDATRPRLMLRCEAQTNRGEDAIIV